MLFNLFNPQFSTNKEWRSYCFPPVPLTSYRDLKQAAQKIYNYIHKLPAVKMNFFIPIF